MTSMKIAAALAMALFALPALAHGDGGPAPGLLAGFVHPLFGLDHVLAMVVVGAWAGLVGGRALWAWPAAFVAVMALGAALALHGVPLPWSEAMLSLSLVTGGLAVAARARTAVSLGALLCGGFALFHGHAHGAELPLEAEAARYVVGFCLATALLHGAGVAATVSLSRTRAQWLPRLSGAAVAATGLVLLAA
ncbi:MAG: hydrogenase/urease accessory protein [Microvirga sp.]|jgi:urease accessory protein|nr:hydrogenase/urease accessory protein [Microvirga sp.]